MFVRLSLAIVGVTIAGYVFFGGESVSMRYRATARIVVGGLEYSGSTVRETRYAETTISLIGTPVSVADRGEAIIVDVGAHHLYVLLNDRGGSKHFPFLVTRCFGLATGLIEPATWITALDRVPIGTTCSLTGSGLETKMMYGSKPPLVVAFRDEAVAKSIFEVTPAAHEQAFGQTATLVEIQLQRVASATKLDHKVDQYLPWLNKMPFDGTHIRTLDPHIPRGLPAAQATLAQRVTDYYFRD